MLLLLSCSPAYAEWVATGSTEEATIYVDEETIRHKGYVEDTPTRRLEGDVVTWWELYDYKIIQVGAGLSYFSSKVQHEYDCTGERLRWLAHSWFSGHMGRGTVVYSSTGEGKWVPVEPGSLGQALWKVACVKQ